jgi:bifunctional UDP-N-acetylglucosamine pyrophosphorylase / glucosamine-1-phosphate N-acetyltransferase
MNVTMILLAVNKPNLVLLPLAGKPIIQHSLETVCAACQDCTPLIITALVTEGMRMAVGPDVNIQGMGHQSSIVEGLTLVEPALAGKSKLVLISQAELPLLKPETLSKLINTQKKNNGPLSMLVLQENSTDADQGVYCFDADWLWETLKRLSKTAGSAAELSDLANLAEADGEHINTLKADNDNETLLIWNLSNLAEAEALLRLQINQNWMMNGVTLVDPNTVYIGPDVHIGQGTVIHPNTHLRGITEVGEACSIGPNTIIDSSRIGSHCKILASVIDPGAILEDHVDMGPFAHLRKGAHLADGVHMGNFGEIKNSYLGPDVKMGHFSYIGDATIGENVNIGAGTITCNYDGEKKHATIIGANAFIGSDTMLVAPLEIGEGANTGAGAVVTKDVPSHSTVVGVPAHLIEKKKDK